MWVVTASVNDYDQYGSYLIAVFDHKPSVEELLSLKVMDKAEAESCVTTGGERLYVTPGNDRHYKLEQVKSGELFQDV